MLLVSNHTAGRRRLVTFVGVLSGCGAAEGARDDVTGGTGITVSVTGIDDGIVTLEDGGDGGTTSSASSGPDDDGGDGPRFDVGDDGVGMEESTGEACAGMQSLMAVARDFPAIHPDFEYVIGVDPGIVQGVIGGDDKPVYAGAPTTPTTNGQMYFDQWYRDVAGVNQPFDVQIDLVDDGTGTFTYASAAFFPLDGAGFGSEGNRHNYHFTLELHTEFLYEGGEVFRFTGDDDLWVFINGKLGIDLGGVHGAMVGQVDLDMQAAQLGITPGNIYRLEFFFAERHTSESNFRIETSIDCLVVD